MEGTESILYSTWLILLFVNDKLSELCKGNQTIIKVSIKQKI